MSTESRLFRFTPPGSERPNHYVDSYQSACAKLPKDMDGRDLMRLKVGSTFTCHHNGKWERVA